LLVTLYGFETWFLALREKHRLRVLENRALGEYWERRGMEDYEVGEDCIMRGFVTYTVRQE
jgi:hypothetical protein